ncbi:L,D-transpeptidase family protein [Afifella aestuarii]|uniref:L,D-transpeptidase family protein n=1 Tax=Afifella aestuarii TaxID=1909496 RepID=UPI0013E3FF73|nr:L,D-transpeptidase family protein [Afifella aestuarii]
MTAFSLLRSSLCAAALLFPLAAQAQNMMPVNQSEWSESFDTGPRTAAPVTSTVPILSPYTVPAMDQAIEWYQGLVDAGGWNSVPSEPALKIGMRHPNVVALRQRLIASGDLRQTTGSDAFDSYVQSAVMRFQERHGIPADGVVGAGTFKALNVPAEVRLNQLRVNRERIAAMKDPASRYVMVNVPGAQIEVVEDGQVVSRHTAVVGKVDRQTPLLSSKIHEINFNPYWTVPNSIIRKDLIPKMQKDPEYLTRNRIRIFTQKGEELQPSQVNWHSDEATNYMFKQDPGDQNSLGSVRMNFYNPYSVFLHDTPSKGLFGSDYRFESSGCVRVMNVRELVAWILRDNGYTRATVDQTIRSGERLDVDVANPPALYTVYFTAWTTGDGVVHFRDDIYNFDAPGEVALNQPSELIGSPLPQ